MIFALIIFALLLIALSYKFKLVRKAGLISLITIVITGFAYQISETSLFKVYVYPESFALEDYEMTDYAFANLRPNPPIEDRIVLVNFGLLPRGEIAQLVEIITKYEPKVIAIDALFNCEDGMRDSINCPQLLDSAGNRRLSNAIRNAGNVVLGSKLLQSDSLSRFDVDLFDSLELPDPLFRNFSKHGFVSLPVKKGILDEVVLCREFWPQKTLANKVEVAFSVRAASLYDSTKAKKFLDRDRDFEEINYRRNSNLFTLLDTEDVLKENFGSDLLKDKIIIMGYLSDETGDPPYGSMFYVPLGKRVAGRGMPNMLGIVVNANIISMILDEDYLDRLSDTHEFILAFLLCFIHVLLLLVIFKKLPVWYDLLALSLVIVQLGFYSWLRLFLFSEFNIQISLVATITSLAIASIAVVLYKELLPHLLTKLRKKRNEVESAG